MRNMSSVSNLPAPKDDTHREAIAFRDELLSKNWPDERQVSAMAEAASRDTLNDSAARARLCGSLLGVWVETDGVFRHPDFQFDASGATRPAVADLLAVLPSNAEDQNGWRRAFWLYSPHARLAGETPAEVFVHDAGSVIDAARAEFHGQTDGCW